MSDPTRPAAESVTPTTGPCTDAAHDSQATVVRLDSIEALSSAQALETALGLVDEVSLEPVSTNGSTQAIHYRVTARLHSQKSLRLWLKVNRVSSDWTALGSGDEVGRESALLSERELAGVWDAFACPYRAFAVEDGVYGLLMDDLSQHLRGEEVAFAAGEEDAVLAAMATLHARFWNSDSLQLRWLQTTWHRMYFLGPHDHSTPNSFGSGVPFDHSAPEWFGSRAQSDPLPLLPQSIAELLTRPTDVLAQRCSGLPWTLFHGDLKAHNLAILPQGRVAVVDWGLLGAGPSTLDVGWYLFRNWRCHARPKHLVLARYRDHLQAALGGALPDGIWVRLVEIALLCGAIMSTRALLRDIANGVQGATDEWDWRIAQLEQLV
jgi:hypothetical protein